MLKNVLLPFMVRLSKPRPEFYSFDTLKTNGSFSNHLNGNATMLEMVLECRTFARCLLEVGVSGSHCQNKVHTIAQDECRMRTALVRSPRRRDWGLRGVVLAICTSPPSRSNAPSDGRQFDCTDLSGADLHLCFDHAYYAVRMTRSICGLHSHTIEFVQFEGLYDIGG